MSFLSCAKYVLIRGVLLTAGAVQAAPAESPLLKPVRQLLIEQAMRAGLANPAVEVTLAARTGAAPACTVPLRVDAVDTRFPRRMRFAVTCPASGTRQEFFARAEISADVVVAQTAVPARRPLAAADMAVERRDVSAIPDAFSDPAAVNGQTSRRSLRPGQIVQRRMLVSAVLVRRGDAVRIVARSGPVEVTAAGEALEAGAADDTIRVRNTNTGKVVRARVAADGTVEPVDLPTFSPANTPAAAPIPDHPPD